jgi:CRP-like cAMP-binding protein
MPIRGAIRNDILRFLLDRSPIVSVKKDDFVFREGDAGQSMFVLESGRVAILKLWKGEQRLPHRLERGECFGEMALMEQSANHLGDVLRST